MANILYRTSTTATIPGSTTAKGSALTNLEMDGNIRSIEADIQTRVTSSNPTFTGYVETPTDLIDVGSNAYVPYQPSLNFEFAKAGILDPRITYTRSGVATTVTAAGYIEEVAANVPRFNYNPLTHDARGICVENVSTNVLLNTEQFDNSYWLKANTIVGLADITAPDGHYTAWSLIASTAASEHYFERNYTTVATSQRTVSSIFVKQGTASQASLAVYGTGNALHKVTLTFATGVAATSNSAEFTSGSGATTNFGAENYGNGWWRIWISGYPDTTATNRRFRVWATSSTGQENYTGDGITPALYIWGAQMELTGEFGSPSTYMPSVQTFTSRTSSTYNVRSDGIVESIAANTARTNYNPSNFQIKPKLLLEPAGDNKLTYTNNLSTNWGLTNLTLNTAATTGPDGVTNSACSITETTAAGVEHYIEQVVSGLTLTETYTRSIWVKANGRSIRILSYSNPTFSISAVIDFDPLTGVLTTGNNGGAVQHARVVFYPTGWWRIIQTFRLGGADTSMLYRVTLLNAGNLFYTGDGASGVYLYGAQLETGVTATSYMPSPAGVFGTRSADVYSSSVGSRSIDTFNITGTNLTDWLRQGEGTFYVEHEYNGAGGASYPGVFSLDDTTSTGGPRSIGLIHADAAGGDPLIVEFFTGQDQNQNGATLKNPVSVTDKFRTAIAYTENNLAAITAGQSLYTDLQVGIPAVNRLCLGALRGNQIRLNGHIRVFRYYPVRLTNTQIQRLVEQ